MEILQTISNTGLLRHNNEDYVYATSHPKDSKIKILVIADGMGGKSFGDIASKETVTAIEEWFYKMPLNKLKEIDELPKSLNSAINEINDNLIKKYGENVLGTTLTIAIIGDKKTLFYSIGDSRGYIYKDEKLIQITTDDSGVWEFYKSKNVEKDDLRFFPINNFITACIGIKKELCNGHFYQIENNYNAILLLTDGVTDLLSDNDIENIMKTKASNNILSEIINTAVYKDMNLKVPIRLRKNIKGRFTIPLHGRDNASGVFYKKN